MSNSERRKSFKKEVESRIGETRTMNCGIDAFIVEYVNYHNILIQFKNTTELKRTNYNDFKNGKIKSSNCKSVFGVGCIGNTPSTYEEDGSRVKSYTVWVDMLRRCYSERFLNLHSSYIGCSACEEWHNYENFKKWYDKNYYEIKNEKMDLDKDILVKGNKVYSPETCVFVPHSINTLFITQNSRRGDLPIGVRFDTERNNYRVGLNIKGKDKFIGRYTDKKDAFMAYKQYKEDVIKHMANEYVDSLPKQLYKSMVEYSVELTD